MSFNVGEKVIYCISFREGVYGVITEVLPQNSYVVKLDSGEIKHNVYTSQLKKAPKSYIDLQNLDCICGVKFIRDGGIHSTWCPVYSRQLAEK